jgi:probable phosphoglycerate mutase
MLYIMRHGKTDWNLLHKLQGKTDIPLNDMGRQMARDARERYKDIHFDVCFSSPLLRARETAELVLEGRDVPVIIDDRLAEMGFGIYEGTEEVFEKPECPVRVLFFNPEKYEAVGGAESLESLIKRTSEFLDEVAMPLVNEGKDVLILGHGAMNSAVIGNIRHKELKDFWAEGLENCKLIKLL